MRPWQAWRAWGARRAVERAASEARMASQHAAAIAEARLEEQRLAVEQWDAADAELVQLVNLARTRGWESAQVEDISVILKTDETWLGKWQADLVQPKTGPSHSLTNYGGFTYKVSDNVRVREGQARTTYTPGVEAPAVMDSGNLVATSHRLIFQGGKRAHEWRYDKLIGYINYDDEPVTSIQVSNRERVSAAQYSWADATNIRFHFAWGLAIQQDALALFAEHLEQQRVALGPRPADPSQSTGVPAAVEGPSD